jgi:hypothetical protein
LNQGAAALHSPGNDDSRQASHMSRVFSLTAPIERLPGCTTTAKADPANRYTVQCQLEECRREKPAQLIETMAKFSQQKASDSEPPSQFKRYLPVLAEAWVLFTIVAFFVARVLGSNVFKHFLRSVSH